ncbi:ABC transporter [Halorhodospira halochloris]|uniref:ABC transporter n=1 Tax=Halorhodospira halochloris TaxID=1052 RepID=A0A0X8X9D0_HALHR|nr:extracellular solute-binding protein [Halorhodospira halochloris]BAU57884.1 ABC transporter [Halorhodospira halochloris]
MASRGSKILIAFMLAGSAGLAAGAAAAKDLTVVSWGGNYTRSQMLGFILSYQDELERDVDVIDFDGGLYEIRRQVDSYNVRWDVVDLEQLDVIRGCRAGLLEPIDDLELADSPDGVAAEDDFIDGAFSECGVGSVVWYTVIGFNADDFGAQPPSTMEDFFDLNEYPGKRGMRRTPMGNLEWALIADGVDPDEVYAQLETEQGLDRAFNVLNRIKPNIIWWRDGQQPIELLRQGRVRMSTVYSGRVWGANEQHDADLEVIWSHAQRSMQQWAITRHGQNQDKAREFIQYATQTGSIVGQVEHIPYRPARRSAESYVPERMQDYLPKTEEDQVQEFVVDAQWWADNFEEINARFERWIDRPVRVPRGLRR